MLIQNSDIAQNAFDSAAALHVTSSAFVAAGLGAGVLMDKSVYRVIRAQVVLTLIISIALMAFMDLRHALSALCGGAIAVLSAYVYARKMRTPAGADASTALRAQYRAELYKLAITIGLFALVFLVFRNAVAASSFFLTYLATVLAYWLALVVRTNT